jgi:hypothetical protein
MSQPTSIDVLPTPFEASKTNLRNTELFSVTLTRNSRVSMEDLMDFVRALASDMFQRVSFTTTAQGLVEIRFHDDASVKDIKFMHTILLGIHYVDNQIACNFGSLQIIHPRKVQN